MIDCKVNIAQGVDLRVNMEAVVGRKIGQIDLSTGEVLEGCVVYLVPKRRSGFGERWFAVAQEALKILKTFTRVEDFRVLMSLLERLDYENLILANQSEIARELGIERAQVNRAIKRLQEAGAIIQGPKFGLNRSYQLNPSFGWKGSAKKHVHALDEYRQERLKVAGITKVLEGGEAKEPT
jgi:Firmicute plasmid replication protein (RepL)